MEEILCARQHGKEGKAGKEYSRTIEHVANWLHRTKGQICMTTKRLPWSQGTTWAGKGDKETSQRDTGGEQSLRGLSSWL